MNQCQAKWLHSLMLSHKMFKFKSRNQLYVVLRIIWLDLPFTNHLFYSAVERIFRSLPLASSFSFFYQLRSSSSPSLWLSCTVGVGRG